MSETLRWSLGASEPAVRTRLEAFERSDLAGRLARRDPSIWGDDEAHVRVASNRMGWIGAPAQMRARAAEFEAFAAEVAAEGFTHAVLLGMGGSSLAPEVLREAFGVAPGRLELAVLDNTAPSAVAAVLAAHDPRRTLFVVASKSGGTLEVVSFEKRCWEWSRSARPDATGQAFVAITDPGTSLEALARSRGYRRTFTNPPDIGGRYSALSCFGLVPAALLGIDVGRLLDAAVTEMDGALLERAAAKNPGLALGAALGELARAGRDKMTLVLEGPFAPLGPWIEQLVAESTGKDGRGLLPVAGEPLTNPLAYGPDRVFVAVSAGPLAAATAARLEALEHAGHPVIRWERAGAHEVGAEFVRWEIATVAAAVALGVDPFDEPNVSEAKAATGEALERALRRDGESSPALARAGGRSVLAPPGVANALRVHVADGSDPLAWAAALPALTGSGDYLAILAYLHATPSRSAGLERLRLALRDRSRAAVTLGWGPRYLHSTGQLHKGGPSTGVFLQIVADEPQEAIPGEPYGFRELQRAQADGDYRVLEKHGRRVLRLDAGAAPDEAIERLAATIESGAAAARASS